MVQCAFEAALYNAQYNILDNAGVVFPLTICGNIHFLYFFVFEEVGRSSAAGREMRDM